MERSHFGWLPDYPDMRDRTFDYSKPNDKAVQDSEKKESIKDMRDKAGAKSKKTILSKSKMPPKAEIEKTFFCSIDEQGDNNSCTAHAGASLVEYFENKASGNYEKKSRMFLYKVTRNLMDLEGDTGAFVRSAMKALVLFGVPPEKYWPYLEENLRKEPTQFCYAFAQNYQAIQYYRLDKESMNHKQVLEEIKVNLVKELPVMFGFTVYNNIEFIKEGMISYPCKKNRLIGGHAVVAIGYDDKKVIPILGESGTTTGALKIRNSWGEGWGDYGYGWLPYKYLESGLAKDFWSIIKNEWINNKEFQ
jgi:C1A family cysteine protease